MLKRIVSIVLEAGVAQSVLCLTADWTTGWSGFDPRQRQRIFLQPLCPDQLWVPGYFPRG
jgi:hypothetical protein